MLIIQPGMTFYGGVEMVIVKLANYLSHGGIETDVLAMRASKIRY